jgi:MFS family permease
MTAYINEMMHDFGVPESQVGIWSATAESVLMVTESFVAPLYAPLADKYGRRTVLIPLLVLWGLFALGFGFATSPWGAVIWRACCE